jgi:hypothetical protein
VDMAAAETNESVPVFFFWFFFYRFLVIDWYKTQKP